MKLIIEDDEGRRTVVPFARPEITIGRDEGNTIRLTERNVSRKHARFVRVNGHVEIEDLGSYNGIRVNGERIEKKAQITERDLIQIGDYDLALEDDGVPVVAAPAAAPSAPPPLPPAPEPSPPLLLADDEETTLDPSPLAEQSPAPAPVPEHLDPTNPRRQPTAVIRLDELELQRARPVVDIPVYEAPQLVVLNTSHAGKTFICKRSEMKIGRTEENDIPLDHRSLSRTHAKLVLENGEWRVIDMQSANGVLVNGEGYAQSGLNFGDLLELGHVKLRFEGPGGTTATPFQRWRGRRLFLFIALGFAGLASAIGGVVLLTRSGRTTPALASAPVSSTPMPVAVPPPSAPPTSPPEVSNPGRVASPPPVPAPAPPRTVTVKPVVVAAAATPPKPKPPPREATPPRVSAPPPAPEGSAREQAERLYNDGKNLHKKQQLREAEQTFKRCLTVDPTFARCHMMLGSTYALLKEFERGAQHYRKFVEMTPDDTHAEQVRILLQKYDESVGQGKPAQR